MDPLSLLIVAGVVALLLGWVVFSKHPLANTIRARLRGQSVKAANVLDDVTDRVESAELTLEQELAGANAGLIEIKTNHKGVEREYNDAMARVAKHHAQAENAASIGRADLAKEALRLEAEAQAEADALKTPLDTIATEEKRVSDAVALLERRLSEVKKEKKTLRSEAKAADVTTRVDSITAGIDTNGYQRDLQRARELLNAKKDKAGAMRDMAAKVEEKDRLNRELEALGTEQTNLDAATEALMAKYAKPAQNSNSSDKANGA